MYNKDYKKQLFPQIKRNCEQIHNKFIESELKLGYNTSDKSFSKENTGEFSKIKSFNFITFDSDIGAAKKKEKKDSDSSSSEDEEIKFKNSIMWQDRVFKYLNQKLKSIHETKSYESVEEMRTYKLEERYE